MSLEFEFDYNSNTKKELIGNTFQRNSIFLQNTRKSLMNNKYNYLTVLNTLSKLS